MGEVGGTDFHYDGERKRPAYAWQCPSCGAANMGRIEEGCPQCSAGKDGKQVGIPKVTRRRPAMARTAETLANPVRLPDAVPAPVGGLSQFGVLIDAAVLVLQYVRPTNAVEISAMQELEKAVAPFLDGVERRTRAAAGPMEQPEPPPPPVQLNNQLLDARTILTLAAALDHFAEQILVNINSDDFLSADEAQELANQLRATLPEDLDSVLPQISAEEPEVQS